MILVTVQGESQLIRKEHIRQIETVDAGSVLWFDNFQYIVVEETEAEMIALMNQEILTGELEPFLIELAIKLVDGWHATSVHLDKKDSFALLEK